MEKLRPGVSPGLPGGSQAELMSRARVGKAELRLERDSRVPALARGMLAVTPLSVSQARKGLRGSPTRGLAGTHLTHWEMGFLKHSCLNVIPSGR